MFTWPGRGDAKERMRKTNEMDRNDAKNGDSSPNCEPSRFTHEIDKEEEEEEIVCAICLEGIGKEGEKERVRLLDSAGKKVCRHRFHLVCILKWGIVNGVCPCCKASFTRVSTVAGGRSETKTASSKSNCPSEIVIAPASACEESSPDVSSSTRRSRRIRKIKSQRSERIRGYLKRRVEGVIGRIERVDRQNRIRKIRDANRPRRKRMRLKKKKQDQQSGKVPSSANAADTGDKGSDRHPCVRH